MVQWVKNPTAANWVTVEVWVQSPSWHSELKNDPELPQPWHRSQSLARGLPNAAGVAINNNKKSAELRCS